MNDVKAELDRKVIQILGEDHPISDSIRNYEEDLDVTTVLLATFTSLNDRIEALEARMEGRH